MKKTVLFLILTTFLMGVIFSMEEKKKDNENHIEKWLVAGPVKIITPPFLDTYLRSDYVKELLEKEVVKIDRFTPVEGKVLTNDGENSVKWEVLKKGYKFSESADDYFIYYFSTYIRVNRFAKLEFNFKIDKPFKVFLDGKDILTEKNPGKDGTKKSVELIEGTHWLLIKVVSDVKFNFSVTYKKDEETKEAEVEFSTSPERVLSKYEILNGNKVSGVVVSDDGRYVAYEISHMDTCGKTHSYFEIWDSAVKRVIFKSPEDLNVKKFLWVSGRNGFLLQVKSGSKNSIYFLDIKALKSKKLLGPEKDVNLYGASPDGRYFVYSRFIKVKDYKDGYKYFRSLEDRQLGSRNKRTVYLYFFDGGKNFPILFNTEKINLLDISEDGKKLLFGKEVIDYKKRPYVFFEYYIYSLKEGKLEKVLENQWIYSATFSPDGEKLALMTSPSAFNNLCLNLKDKGKIPNDYDNQLVIYDLKSKRAICSSKNFYPSLIAMNWVKDDMILLKVNDTVYDNLYIYNPVKKEFKKLSTEVDVVRDFGVSRDGRYVAYSGVKVQKPEAIYFYNVLTDKNILIEDVNENLLRNVKLGKLEDFSFIDKDGYQIVGRIYYPPYFDSHKKYPAIIYYYGGTLPIERDFGGRYPKNWWAARGYVVYVLQPRGTVGFGQEFSAFHVNDWGTKAGEDIIEGTKKFLKSHPFVDPKRVGIIGASYGGFMTMSLLTRTDMYAAAVSHAGISDLTHYWGEGYWGYTYSSVATANSFPWNRKDIYVGKSPVYGADKIKTPLLLLQGTDDTNVPTGESDIMFTALKLLGVPTALVKFKGENHWILEYKHRVKWMDTIIAWFDKWLKSEPQMWESMYPEKK